VSNQKRAITYSKQAQKYIAKQDKKIKSVLKTAIEGLPDIDDDYLTDEDLDNIRKSREEYARGEFVRHEDIDWD